MIVYATMLIVGGFCLTVLFTALAKRLAFRMELVARPRADRHHRTIVPLGGGIALFGTLFLTLALPLLAIQVQDLPASLSQLMDRSNLQWDDVRARSNELWVLLLCITSLFVLGMCDDCKGLGPRLKLIVQFCVAGMAAAWAEIRFEFFIESQWVTVPLSALWIVLLVNVFNFLDNMDGACAGIAAVVSSILFVGAVTSGQILVGGLTLVFVGALLGFLLFNFPPARIFMGDAGSLIVGFMVAVFSVRTTYYQEALSGTWHHVMIPLIALAVPLYDFVSVMTLRLRQGKNLFVGDTQHFSHRLKRRGLTDTQTVLTLYLATLCTGLGATFLYQVDLTGAILIFVQTVMVLALMAIFESNVRQDT